MLIQEEKYIDMIEEALDLMLDHWVEVRGEDPDLFKPDHGTYTHMELIGRFKVLTARDEGELIGYAGVFVNPSLQYKDITHCFVEALYVKPSHRGYFTGIKLLKKAQSYGDQIEVRSPLKTDFSPLLKRLGYREIERVFTWQQQSPYS